MTDPPARSLDGGLSYHDALRALAERGRFGIRLGLGRTRALLRALDHPERSVRGALIAGTNGKGSVLALVDSALRAAGYHVGTTPKPHLVTYRERIQIDGQPIAPADFARLVERAIAAAERIAPRFGEPTEFELLTAVVFARFAEVRPDVALVEVGLGGRLDATHAWDGGVAVVTNVDLDHMAQLGDTIPKIAMVIGGYDKIDYSMKKLGIEEFYRYGDAPAGLPGGDGPGIKTGKTGNALMNDAAEMGQNHIVLLPCAAMGYSEKDPSVGSGFLCGAPTGVQKTAFKSYVDGGGKLYVTDFAYEAVRQTWPGFITFYDDTMQPLTNPSQGIGTACRGGAEDTQGTAKDKGLGDWLTAIGDGNPQLQAAWSRIESVHSQPGTAPDGTPKTITPKVWMTSDIGSGTQLPATVSFEQKCGRVLFSTYHCEGDSQSKLLAQEKALLYVLLEVGVCVGELPPPPPPR